MHTTWSFKRHSVDLVIRRSQKSLYMYKRFQNMNLTLKKVKKRACNKLISGKQYQLRNATVHHNNERTRGVGGRFNIIG